MFYDDNGIFIGMLKDDAKDIWHYGTPRHSGRYPWGSGDNPYQRNVDFLGRIKKMESERDANGNRLFNEVQIAASMGMNTSELRKRKKLALEENRAYLRSEAIRLKEKGMSTTAIAKRMGLNESSVRGYLDDAVNQRMTKTKANAEILKERVKEVGLVQVGAGSELYLNNASSTSLGATLKLLENEGYTIHNVQVDQLGTGHKTTVKVLAAPGTEWKDVAKNTDKIRMPVDIYMKEGELVKADPPPSVDSKRVMVRYAEDGGVDRDGLIEVRRGVEDLNLGRNHYVQGRILVDNTHYLKGMITYADDLPDGIDIRFNTNKHAGTPMINPDDKDHSVLKPIKDDSDNIFGANIKPSEKLMRATDTYIGKDGKEHQSAINIVKEEGDVDSWSKNLASQFLSKQSPELAKAQLKITEDNARADLSEIASYTNPVVKAKMLEDFAGRCDHDSVHMAAAALPRQKTKFIMPLTDIKDNEAYLPGYKDGEQVALVRYPHGSIAEIPIVTVNNQSKTGKRVLGDAIDAIGISKKTADQLSGADFDGDTVLVLPTDTARIKSKPQYDKLKDFDDKEAYPGYPGMARMTKQQRGMEMGRVSNLLTDMTIKKASDDEIVRALKHSMVVIDAEKHGLDWKRSEIENGIPQLMTKYQGKSTGGASTLLSRSTAQDHIPERKLKAPSKMSPEELARYKSGEEVYVNTGRKLRDPKFYRNRMTDEEKKLWDSGPEGEKEVRSRFWKDGRVEIKQKGALEKTKKGYTHDPFELVSTGSRETTTPIERVYGDFSRSMKNIATEARAMARNLDIPKANPEARKKYASEVKSLDAKLAIARRNAPLEKQAQIMANSWYKMWLDNNPEEDAEHKKRQRGQLLDRARKQVGAKKLQIGSKDNPLTPKEWEAIQNNAISPTKLKSILQQSDMQVVKKYALPKNNSGMSSTKVSRAKSLLKRGFTRAEVCDMLDISENTLIKAVGYADV